MLCVEVMIQRRGDFGEPRVDFERDWISYKDGFGDRDREFWLGNEPIHQLTKSGNMKLRVELEAHDENTAWAEYDTFRWNIYLLVEMNKPYDEVLGAAQLIKHVKSRKSVKVFRNV